MIVQAGLIASIELPAGWTERRIERRPLVAKTIRSFHNDSDPNIQLRLVYRGYAESEQVGEVFQACLQRPTHQLDEEELEQLRRVLSELAEPSEFTISRAETRELKSRQVLWVEGTYVESPYWLGAAFIPVNSAGRVIEEIACFCEHDHIADWRPKFEAILNTIVWNPMS